MEYELYHYGVKGMRWGVRRYQKKDGSLTALGRKHKSAAIKGLEDARSEKLKEAAVMESYAKTNKAALDKSKKEDKARGETSWATQALTDAHKAAGRRYIQAMYDAEIYNEYIKAYKNDTIKAGQDYVTKNLKQGIVQLTESGRAKEREIVDRTTADYRKKHAKEIDRYA